MYLKDNLCSIYEQRPILCRIDDAYNKYFKQRMSLEEYYNENYKICKLLKSKKQQLCQVHLCEVRLPLLQVSVVSVPESKELLIWQMPMTH